MGTVNDAPTHFCFTINFIFQLYTKGMTIKKMYFVSDFCACAACKYNIYIYILFSLSGQVVHMYINILCIYVYMPRNE